MSILTIVCLNITLGNFYFYFYLVLFILFYLFIYIFNTFYLIKNSIGGFCSVSGSFGHMYA